MLKLSYHSHSEMSKRTLENTFYYPCNCIALACATDKIKLRNVTRGGLITSETQTTYNLCGPNYHSKTMLWVY